jgi:hypothetical protein
MADFYVGDVVFTTCQATNKPNRPHFVTASKNGRIGLCPLSHTPQGKYEITEMGGGTYVAAWDRFKLRTNVRWAEAGESLRLRPQQLSDECITATMAEIRRQMGR